MCFCSDLGRTPQILSFVGTTVTLRQRDGSLVPSSVPHYPAMLHEYSTSARWEDAVQLCRFASVRPPHDLLCGTAKQGLICLALASHHFLFTPYLSSNLISSCWMNESGSGRKGSRQVYEHTPQVLASLHLPECTIYQSPDPMDLTHFAHFRICA